MGLRIEVGRAFGAMFCFDAAHVAVNLVWRLVIQETTNIQRIEWLASAISVSFQCKNVRLYATRS